jgi:hypothetical protein
MLYTDVSAITMLRLEKIMDRKALPLFAPALIIAALGLPFVLGAEWMLANLMLSDSLRVVLGLLPIVPGIGLVLAFVHAVRGLDELQKQIHLHAAAITFCVTIVLTFVFGGLQRAGIYTASWDDIGNNMLLIWAAA